jgi:tight adherence protein B
MRAASLIVAAALLFAAPAAAANSLEIGAIDSSGYPTVRFSVVAPQPSTTAPTVQENDRPVSELETENLTRGKTIVLAVDRSHSMEGKALADAVAAARSFVASKPAADRLALIGFSRQALQLTGFSSSTIDADAALGSLAVDNRQGTALYDAVHLGARALETEPLRGRVLVVLTDGDDVSSRTTLAKAAAAAKRAEATVYTIGIEGDGFSPNALEQLARVTGGAYFPTASSSAVDAAYRAISERLRRTWRVSYRTSARPGESVRVETTLGSNRASVGAWMPTEASAPVESGGSSSSMPDFLYESNFGIVLLALLAGILTILAVGLVLATPGGTRLRRRIEPHTAETRKRRASTTPRGRFAAFSSLFSKTENSLAHLNFWKRLDRLIERGDLPLRTVELFYICLGSAVLLGLASSLAGMGSLAGLAALACGALAPTGFAWFKARKRMKAFDEQLPELLMTLAGSLQAGHSFRQGLQAVVDEGHAPAADEFKRVLAETTLGRPMDAALKDLSERIGSKNLDFVITAVTIQRQVGGSLAGIIDMIGETVRQRQQFAKKVKGLTAMGRMSAYVLVGIPFFLAFVFTLMNPEYMSPLWHSSAGHMMIAVGLAMMGFGSLVLRKIVSFRS